MQTFYKKFAAAVISLNFLFFFTAITVKEAQPAQVTVKLLSEKPSVFSENIIRRVMIESDKRTIIGHLSKKDKRFILSLPDQPPLELPYDLEIIVSHDGKTILQFGDKEIKFPIQVHTDLYWMNPKGEVISQLVNYYAGNALVSMSDDGYTAVKGNLFEQKEKVMIGLYTPLGEKLYETEIKEGLTLISP